ncbi:hypothetical protein K0I73_01375 [Shewanella mesophila]|uniref:hypothetical protein n=1 Tax=Shewanella mesophila TaxID=2864208 RepID=UPI001C65A8E9|nr:hypothetical protein [Shewanella mesophila]QYJ86442.1 hypothetical protein K0I73_01375 [Shewanella mesophila]
MKKYIVATLVVIAALYWFFQTPSINSPYSYDSIKTSQPPLSSSLQLDTEELHAKADSPNNYQSCILLIESNKNTRRDWANEQDWDQWLDKGYSIDDITLAIDHFSSQLHAANWRVKQLKFHSQLSKQNRELDEQAKQQFPEIYTDFVWERPVPQPSLKNITELSDDDAIALIQATGLTVDDVDWLLQQDSLSEALLFHAVNKLEDVNALLGDHIFAGENLHLIETAAANGQERVLNLLLTKNSELSNDPYLGTTMEYALAHLDYFFSFNKPLDDGAFARQVRIIKTLQALNSPANFTSQTEQQIAGHFPRNIYQFDAEQLAILQNEFELDLTQIVPKKSLAYDPNSPLIEELNTDLTQALAKQTSPAQLTQCQLLVENVNSQWQPHDLSYFSHKLIREGKQVNVANLNDIDPVLADCFSDTQRQRLPYRRSNNKSLNDAVYRLAKQKQIKKAIKMVENSQLEEAVNRDFFYQLLGYNPEYFTPLQLSQLRQETFDYNRIYRFSRKNITSLITQGLDIDKLDYEGRSLLDMAILNQDLTLLKYLVSHHISYPARANGRDPLYLLLDTNNYQFNPEHLLEYLSALMVLEPNIYPYHQRLMSLIRLKYPEIYTQITNQLPRLIVKDDTPLPPAVCHHN